MTPFERKRIAAGFSQSGLARAIGVTHRAVAKWDSGKAMPEPRRIPRLAELLKITPDELLDLIAPASMATSYTGPASPA